MNSAPVPRRALVVTFDQLPTSILGCYGNEWIETPHLDRLAATGFAFDQCWATRVGPQSADDAFSVGTMLARLRPHGSRTVLFQEAASHVDFSAAAFNHVETRSGDSTASAKPDQIPLAVLVNAVLQAIPSSREGERDGVTGFETGLLWVHTRGLTLPAMPPPGFAELYQDEFEDRGVEFETLSELERQVHSTIAAGAMSLLDHWLGELFRQLATASALPTLVIVTAAQGAAWQTLPNSFGPLDELRSQSVHVPMIVQAVHDERFAGMGGLRTSELLRTADLGLLLDWWFQGDVASTGDFLAWMAQHQRDCIRTHSETGVSRITTADWGVIFPPSVEELIPPALFHKPEDTWEVNNVAEVVSEVVETLRNALGSGT